MFRRIHTAAVRTRAPINSAVRVFTATRPVGASINALALAGTHPVACGKATATAMAWRSFGSGGLLAAATATAASAGGATAAPVATAAGAADHLALADAKSNAGVRDRVRTALSATPAVSDWNVVLYQYQTCPFCNKVRAFLDFYQIPYRVVEVNPSSKPELKWSNDYKKVPVLTLGPAVSTSGPIRIVDSTDIISALFENLPANHPTQSVRTVSDDTAKWRKWTDDHLIHLFPPNIYRTLGESFASFDYMVESSSMSWGQRMMSKVGGGIAMYFVGKRNIKKYGIAEPRKDLFLAANKWSAGLAGAAFHGGAIPDLADVTVFGAFRSLAGFGVGKEIFDSSVAARNTDAAFRDWYARMNERTPRSYRTNPLPKPTRYGESTVPATVYEMGAKGSTAAGAVAGSAATAAGDEWFVISDRQPVPSQANPRLLVYQRVLTASAAGSEAKGCNVVMNAPVYAYGSSGVLSDQQYWRITSPLGHIICKAAPNLSLDIDVSVRGQLILWMPHHLPNQRWVITPSGFADKPNTFSLVSGIDKSTNVLPPLLAADEAAVSAGTASAEVTSNKSAYVLTEYALGSDRLLLGRRWVPVCEAWTDASRDQHANEAWSQVWYFTTLSGSPVVAVSPPAATAAAVVTTAVTNNTTATATASDAKTAAAAVAAPKQVSIFDDWCYLLHETSSLFLTAEVKSGSRLRVAPLQTSGTGTAIQRWKLDRSTGLLVAATQPLVACFEVSRSDKGVFAIERTVQSDAEIVKAAKYKWRFASSDPRFGVLQSGEEGWNLSVDSKTSDVSGNKLCALWGVYDLDGLCTAAAPAPTADRRPPTAVSCDVLNSGARARVGMNPTSASAPSSAAALSGTAAAVRKWPAKPAGSVLFLPEVWDAQTKRWAVLPNIDAARTCGTYLSSDEPNINSDFWKSSAAATAAGTAIPTTAAADAKTVPTPVASASASNSASANSASANSAGTAADTKTAVTATAAAMRELRVITYNIWFSLWRRDQRMSMLLELWESKKPDVICLQEVVPATLSFILKQKWIRDSYCVSSSAPDSVKPYGVLILSRLTIHHFSVTKFETFMARTLLVAHTHMRGEPVAIATAHLESMNNAKYRMKQMSVGFNYLKQFRHSAFMGDFNFGGSSMEQDHFTTRHGADFKDLWPTLRGIGDSGYSMTHGGSWRPDRFCLRRPAKDADTKTQLFQPNSIELIGTEEFRTANEPNANVTSPHWNSHDTGCWTPSDHFGLFVTLKVRP